MVALYVPACLGLIGIVLLQKGKGVGFAGAFGIGPGSDTVFGPRMSRSLPVKLTYVMAGVFLVMAMSMSLISHRIGVSEAPAKVDEAAVLEQQKSFKAGLDALNIVSPSGTEEGTPEAPEGAATESPAAEAPATEQAPAESAGNTETPAPAEGQQ